MKLDYERPDKESRFTPKDIGTLTLAALLIGTIVGHLFSVTISALRSL